MQVSRPRWQPSLRWRLWSWPSSLDYRPAWLTRRHLLLLSTLLLLGLTAGLLWQLQHVDQERANLQAELAEASSQLDQLAELMLLREREATAQTEQVAQLNQELLAQIEQARQFDLLLADQWLTSANLRQQLSQANLAQARLLDQQQSERRQQAEREAALTGQLSEREASLGQLNEQIEVIHRRLAESEALAQRLRQLLGLPQPTGAAGGELPREAVTLATADQRLVLLVDRIDRVNRELMAGEQLLQQRLERLKQVAAAGRQPRLPTAAATKAPFGWPVQGRISSGYGLRRSPFTGEPTFHGGIDIVVKTGTPVRATQAGLVTAAGLSGAYGYVVIIQHEGGFETLYAHNSRLVVRRGQRIEKGQVISYSGNTGRSTGPHLHYEIRYQRATIDPAPFLAGRPG